MKSFLSSALALVFASAAFAAASGAPAPAPTPAPADAYPLTTCVVSGETLGEMGDPVIYTYKEDGKPDREVRFCCKMCIGKFKKDPAKYLAILDAAAMAEHHAGAMDDKACCADGSCGSDMTEKADGKNAAPAASAAHQH